jgi:hypothetical protein
VAYTRVSSQRACRPVPADPGLSSGIRDQDVISDGWMKQHLWAPDLETVTVARAGKRVSDYLVTAN